MGTRVYVSIRLWKNGHSKTVQYCVQTCAHSLVCRIVYDEAKEGEIEKKELIFNKKYPSQTGNQPNSSNIHGSVTSPVSPCQTMSCTVEDVLQLLRHLFVIYTKPENDTSICKCETTLCQTLRSLFGLTLTCSAVFFQS